MEKITKNIAFSTVTGVCKVHESINEVWDRARVRVDLVHRAQGVHQRDQVSTVLQENQLNLVSTEHIVNVSVLIV